MKKKLEDMSDYTKHYLEEIQKAIQRGIDYGRTPEEKKQILKKFENIMQECLRKHNMEKDFEFKLEFSITESPEEYIMDQYSEQV